MIAGPNDRCPCGSGKKFKRCCQGIGVRQVPVPVAKREPAPLSVQTPATPPPPSRPRLPTKDLVDNLALTPGFVTEVVSRRGAFKTIQMVPAYGIAKLAEDPLILEDPALAPHLRRHLRDDWTLAKVAAMGTEAIEDQLRRYGVQYTREDFLVSTREDGQYSAWAIAEGWWEESEPTCREKDDDFLGMAAYELWKRLAADRPSTEMLDDWMQDGYRLEQQGRQSEACDLWWRVWSALQPRFDKSMRAPESTAPVFGGLQYLGNWLQNFRNCLSDGARRDRRLASLGVRLCREAMAQFAEAGEGWWMAWPRALAEFHFWLEEIAEGEAVLRRAIERFPKNVWGYVALADTYSRLFKYLPGPPKDDARAIGYLEMGLARAGPKDKDRQVLLDRLETVRKGR